MIITISKNKTIHIDKTTGNGRVIEMHDNVPHSAGFAGGDDKTVEALGIADHIADIWTQGMRDNFLARKAEQEAMLEAMAK